MFCASTPPSTLHLRRRPRAADRRREDVGRPTCPTFDVARAARARPISARRRPLIPETAPHRPFAGAEQQDLHVRHLGPAASSSAPSACLRSTPAAAIRRRGKASADASSSLQAQAAAPRSRAIRSAVPTGGYGERSRRRTSRTASMPSSPTNAPRSCLPTATTGWALPTGLAD